MMQDGKSAYKSINFLVGYQDYGALQSGRVYAILTKAKGSVASMCKPAFAYLLQCADGSLYAGWTNDPDARLLAHNKGAGAKYTRARRPVTLAYLERCGDQHAAMRREAELKRMTRTQKLALIEVHTAKASL